jgi:DNA-binding MarR family transcriptional regulator
MAAVKPRRATRSELVADRLHSAAIHLLRRVRQQDAPLGVGPTQLSVLSVLVFGGPKNLKDLAALEQVTPATMSRVVAGLERAGFAIRAADPHDRRTLHITPTSTGRVLLRRGRARRVTALAEWLKSLTHDELDCLERAAELVERVLPRVSPPLRAPRLPPAPRSSA